MTRNMVLLEINYDLFSIGSTVVVQWEDGGPWTHSTVVGRGNHNHNSRA